VAEVTEANAARVATVTTAPARASRRRVMALGALWTVVMGATSFASGCYGHNCDGDVLVFGHAPGEGQLLDANTWQSGPIDGAWLPFPKQRTWIFELRELGDRVPAVPLAYVSAEADPLHVGGNFTVGAGNIVELSGADKGRLVVHNGTCADYYVRVVVQSAPVAPAGGVPDASTAAPTSGPTDAGGDAEAGP
jgi:hypothetical protein